MHATTASPSPGTLRADSLLAVLDLLNEERITSSEEIARLLGAEQVSPSTTQAIIERIHRVQAHLARAGQRRDQLAALFESSRELAEQRDFPTLLRRLTERARHLAGADLAWLSEFAEDMSELIVQATAGSVSAALHNMHVALGQGMAWYVADQRRLHYSPQYHSDPAFAHDAAADDALRVEGVVSVLALPLIVGDDVIGTLCLATRTETKFYPDLVGLLTAFADHGAVILQGARLLARARTSAAAADDARGRLARYVDEMERAHLDHVELTECVLRGEGVGSVAAVLRSSLQRDVLLLDSAGEPLADSPVDLPVAGCWRHPAVAAAITRSRSTGRYVPTSAPGIAGVVAVLAGDSHLGSLAVGRTTKVLDGVQHNTIEDAARVMALLRLKQDAITDAEERVRGELLHDLVEPGDRGIEEARLRARARGLRIDGLTRLFLISAGAGRDAVLRALRGMTPAPRLMAEHTGRILAAYDREDDIGAEVIYRVVRPRVGGDVIVVAAPAAADLAGVAPAYREARRCLDLLPALRVVDGAVDTAAYRVYLRLFDPNAADIDEFVGAMIGPVLEWDRQRGTDLMETLRVYAECTASVARAARELHLHPNTVQQRLARVDALLGEQWRDPDAFFRIQVALRIHHLRGVPAADYATSRRLTDES